ncbi:uncharacterized protein LOC128553991 [Mercenaria mercenaria]|uniref:uncharacterized protein LOC128553991 n=1 Tax=Mercenaria mercenaria TaxID=6596 RepID=UPI00234FAA74|nr:uncharacterized protein LOC128553991 [Mercenaria mercenaria]
MSKDPERKLSDIAYMIGSVATRVKTCSFSPVVMKGCNGGSSVSFSRAWISIEKKATKFSLVNYGLPAAFLYEDGLRCLLNTMLERKTEENNVKKRALDCIKKFIFEDLTKHEECLAKLKQSTSHGASKRKKEYIQSVLAAHLFGPLVPESADVNRCSIDRLSQKATICKFCQEKLVVIKDTTFGNYEVWYGRADMILQKSAIVVNKGSDTVSKLFSGRIATCSCQSTSSRSCTSESDQDSSSSSSDTCNCSEVEIKSKGFEGHAQNQAIAQCISNAFYVQDQSQLSDVFIPSFLANDNTIKIYMYCCSNDILLESESMPILRGDTINVATVITVWLAINFDYFDLRDLKSKEMAQKLHLASPKSMFKTLIGAEALYIYEHKLHRPLDPKQTDKEEKDDERIDVHPLFQEYLNTFTPYEIAILSKKE